LNHPNNPLRVLLFTVALSVLVITAPAAAQNGPVTITWFVGIGTGTQPSQIEIQQTVIDEFNSSQDDIQLELVVEPYNTAPATLRQAIDSGTAPDIIGPVGGEGTAAFRGEFLDLQPLVEEDDYDLDQFINATVEAQRVDGDLIGLPIAIYPAMLMYRPALFDAANLNYPPSDYGQMYMLDGEEVPWSIETMSEVAMRLTLDADGNNATDADFNPGNVVQWGFYLQNAGPMRQTVTLFGAGSLVNDDREAVMPQFWREGFQWFYDGIWEDHFIAPLSDSSDFASGNVAMARAQLWYTCCITDAEWDAGALPAYEGQVTAQLHSDAFRIYEGTEHPEEAFEVLTYLADEASLELLSAYGGMPARQSDQPAFFAEIIRRYPQGVNWNVVQAGIDLADNPSHEEWLPNDELANERIDEFRLYIESTPDLDIDAEIDQLLIDLQEIYDAYDPTVE
jgi:multiple sugar transport system substrate-binding protein